MYRKRVLNEGMGGIGAQSGLVSGAMRRPRLSGGVLHPPIREKRCGKGETGGNESSGNEEAEGLHYI